MVSELKFSKVTDSQTGTTFAVVVLRDGVVSAHGSVKQGKDWADWVNSGTKSINQIRLSLDPSLRMSAFGNLNEETVGSHSASFGATTTKELLHLTSLMPKAIELNEIKTANDPEPFDPRSEDETQMEPEAESIASWSINQVSLSMFDVQLKTLAVDFKARRFVRDGQFCSFLFSAKAVKAKIVGIDWVPMPLERRDFSGSLANFDRKIKTAAFNSLGKIGYFEKMIPIGASNLPRPEVARDADRDRLIYEGIPYVNMGKGIPDPTPFGTGSPSVQGLRSFGGRVANIFEEPSRLTRTTRRDEQNFRRMNLVAASSDLDKLTPKIRNSDSDTGRLRRRLSGLIDQIGESYERQPNDDQLRTRREARRIADASSRISDDPAASMSEGTDKPTGGSREIVGTSPTQTPRVEASDRTEKEVSEIVAGLVERGSPRAERGDKPRSDGNSLAKRLIGRISRISNKINSAEEPKKEIPDSMDFSPVEAYDGPQPRVVSDDPWAMDEATKLEFEQSLIPSATTNFFNSRFASDEIEFSDHTPMEQSNIKRAMADYRNELFQRLTEMFADTEDVRHLDYLEDGRLTPRSVIRAARDSHFPFAPQGTQFYDDVRSLSAMDDFLNTPSWDSRKLNSLWRRITDKNRNRISRTAEIPDKTRNTANRASGAIGERTVISPKTNVDDPSVRSVVLSKLQPRRLIYATQKVSPQSGNMKLRDYQAIEQLAIIESAKEMRQSIAGWLRGNMGIASDGELSEDVIASWMATSTPEAAQKIKIFAHNLIVLDDLLQARRTGDGDEEWDSLTALARDKILGNANVGTVPTVAKISSKPPRKSRKNTPSVPAPPTSPTASNTADPVDPIIGASPLKKPMQVPELRDSENIPVVDATSQNVTMTAEDGTQTVRSLTSFGKPDQYDFSNAILVDGVPYVLESRTGLYRNPVDGTYLEDYSNVYVSVQTDIVPAEVLEQVSTSKALGEIRSYPSFQVATKEASKTVGLSNRNTMSQRDVLAQIFGLDATQTQELIGKKIYLVPNVSPGRSTNTARQATLLYLHTNSLTKNIPQSELMDLTLMEVVEIPDGSDAGEAYLNHIGRPDIATAYRAGGKTPDFFDYDKTSSARDSANITKSDLLPAHLRSGGREYHVSRIFGDPARKTERHQYKSLIREIDPSDAPNTKKMIVLWHHPENFFQGYRYSGGNTQMTELARVINLAIKTDQSEDWFKAYNLVRTAYEEAKRSRDAALAKWRGERAAKSRGPRPRKEFIFASDFVETLETIISEIFAPNMNKIVDAVKLQKQRVATSTNSMSRLRVRSQSKGLRNVAGLDDSDLYPPKGTDGADLAPRKPEEIFELLEKHATLGFLPTVRRDLAPSDGLELFELSDEAIDTLAMIKMAVDMEFDIETQSPIGEAFPDLLRAQNRINLRRASLHNAVYWANGNKGKPILVTENEYALLAGSTQNSATGSDYVYDFYNMRRGIAGASKGGKTLHAMAQEFVDGPFYVVGEGGNAAGDGVNFAREGGMDGYGGSDPQGDLILALVPKTARLDSSPRISELHGQLVEMFGAFFSSISSIGGTEKSTPIDLEATDDPDWSHDNPLNYAYDSARVNLAHAYYVPHRGQSIGAHRGTTSGIDIIALAERNGVSLSGIDTADVDAIKDLANRIQATAAELYANSFRNEDDSATIKNSPLWGSQWWDSTRAQVFGWMVQLEILKAMEIAKMKASGKVAWNERIANLVRAQEMLTWWKDSIVQSMLFGIDVLSAESLPSITDPSLLLTSGVFGSHILVINRTSIVVLNRTATTQSEREIYDLIRNPFITDSEGKVFNPYRNRYIDNPDLNGGS